MQLQSLEASSQQERDEAHESQMECQLNPPPAGGWQPSRATTMETPSGGPENGRDRGGRDRGSRGDGQRMDLRFRLRVWIHRRQRGGSAEVTSKNVEEMFLEATPEEQKRVLDLFTVAKGSESKRLRHQRGHCDQSQIVENMPSVP